MHKMTRPPPQMEICCNIINAAKTRSKTYVYVKFHAVQKKFRMILQYISILDSSRDICRKQ